MLYAVAVMSRRKAVQFSRAGFNAGSGGGDGGDDDGGSGGKIVEEETDKRASLKEGRERGYHMFSPIS